MDVAFKQFESLGSAFVEIGGRELICTWVYHSLGLGYSNASRPKRAIDAFTNAVTAAETVYEKGQDTEARQLLRHLKYLAEAQHTDDQVKSALKTLRRSLVLLNDNQVLGETPDGEPLLNAMAEFTAWQVTAANDDLSLLNIPDALALGETINLELFECKQMRAYTAQLFASVYDRHRARGPARRECATAIKNYEWLSQELPGGFDRDLAATYADSGTIYLSAGMTREARIDYDKAIQKYRDLLVQAPDEHEQELAETLNGLGNALRDDGEFDAALSVYIEARNLLVSNEASPPKELPGSATGVLGNIGSTLFKLGRLSEAEERLNQALTEHETESDARSIPQQSMIWANLGRVYQQQGNTEKARSAHQKAIKLAEDPDIGIDLRHLRKGVILESYGFVHADETSDPARAYLLAAAMRESSLFTTPVSQEPLNQLQQVLKAQEERQGVFIATAGPQETVTLGLVTENDVVFESLESAHWLDLFKWNRKENYSSKHQTLAELVWKEIPPSIRQYLLPSSPTKLDIIVCGDPVWLAFPWELIKFGKGELDHLGLHHAFPRCRSILANAIDTLLAKSDGQPRAEKLGWVRRVKSHRRSVRQKYLAVKTGFAQTHL